MSWIIVEQSLVNMPVPEHLAYELDQLLSHSKKGRFPYPGSTFIIPFPFNFSASCGMAVEYFDFFGSFTEPFWGINFFVDVSGAREFAADSRISLFTCLLYGIMKAANAQENFRYRIEENDIVLYDRIHPSFTVAREDRSFCFAFTEYTENFQVFAENLAKEIARVKKMKGLFTSENDWRTDVVHFSAIPWIPFTGLTHARNFAFRDSAVKISTGKIEFKDGAFLMPLACYAHHGFADASHIGAFYENLHELFRTFGSGEDFIR